MTARAVRYLSIRIGIVTGLLIIACSSPEPTPAPTPTPIPTPARWEVYTDSFGIEWELLGLADDAVAEAWLAFTDSLAPSGQGYPGTAVTVEAALNTYVLRSNSMQEKLKTITPPPECELFHVLLTEVAKVGVESAYAMQEIVDAGFINESTTHNLDVSMAQVSAVADDLNTAQRECR